MSHRWTDPVTAFREIAAVHPRMFWLDGGGSRAWSGRRSILGWLEEDDVSLTYDAARREVTRHVSGTAEVVGDDIFAVLADQVARDAADAGVSWVGYLGYACRPDLPARTGDPAPDAVWMRSRQHVVFEHDPGEPTSSTDPSAGSETAPGGGTAGQPPVDPPVSGAEYAHWFAHVQAELRRGNSYEVNLTYRQSVDTATDPVSAYLALRRTNPAPYAGFLQHPGVALLSSSPERFATVDRRRRVQTKPIKGTTPRGATAAEDERNRRSLAEDPRFRAENLMIVDLLRNDLSMVCETGSVRVPALMEVESYASVHQLVSTVSGHLRDDVDTVAALRALFPAGSMTGAPKLRTMEIIADVETSPRGPYSGAFGWIGSDGRADLGVVIRSLVATPGPGGSGRWRYTLGTGGGVTVHSDAGSEYDETRWKVERLLLALG